jgi:hypothetical protein
MVPTGPAASLHDLTPRQAEAGARESVERMLQEKLAAGNINALNDLAKLREADNDPVGARNIRRSGITADGAPETKRNRNMILADAGHELTSRLHLAYRRRDGP